MNGATPPTVKKTLVSSSAAALKSSKSTRSGGENNEEKQKNSTSTSFSIPFPFLRPYPQQLKLMAFIRTVIDFGKIGFVESPTGTGKTQVLLNSTLSWLKMATRERREFLIGSSSSGKGVESLQDPVQLVYTRHDRSSMISHFSKKERVGRKRLHSERPGGDHYSSSSSSSSSSTSTAGGVAKRKKQRVGATNTLLQKKRGGGGGGGGGLIDVDVHGTDLLEGNNDHEEQQEEALYPTRMPKLFYTSRTHSQLSQVAMELDKAMPLHCSSAPSCHDGPQTKQSEVFFNGVGDEGCQEKEKEEQESLVYPLFQCVHVASRQQLCVNAAIRQKATIHPTSSSSFVSSDILNELCIECCNNGSKAKGGRKGTTKKEEEEEEHFDDNMVEIEDFIDVKNPRSTGSDQQQVDRCPYADRTRLSLLRDHLRVRTHSLPELKALGERIKACPYLASREMVRESNIVLMPYSYLVDEKMRNGICGMVQHDRRKKNRRSWDENGERNGKRFSGGNEDSADIATENEKDVEEDQPNSFTSFLDDSVVIFDEGHNLSDAVNNALSVTISSHHIQLFHDVLQLYLSYYEKRLLTKNKSKMREICFALQKILTYGEKEMTSRRSSSSSSSSSIQRKNNLGMCEEGACTDPPLSTRPKDAGAEEVFLLLSLNDFTFNAHIDHINFISLVNFIEENLLVKKWSGFILWQYRRFLKATSTNLNDQNFENFLSKHFPQSLVKSSSVVVDSASSLSMSSNLYNVLRFLELFSKAPEAARLTLKEVVPVASSVLSTTTSFQIKLFSVSAEAALAPVVNCARSIVVAGGTLQPMDVLAHDVFPADAAAKKTEPERQKKSLMMTEVCSPAEQNEKIMILPRDQKKKGENEEEELVGTNNKEAAVFLCTMDTRSTKDEGGSVNTIGDIITASFGHVVEADNFQILTLGTGPAGEQPPLKFTYQTKSQRPAQLVEVYSIVLNIARMISSPSSNFGGSNKQQRCGVVMFFPSYAMMEMFQTILYEPAASGSTTSGCSPSHISSSSASSFRTSSLPTSAAHGNLFPPSGSRMEKLHRQTGKDIFFEQSHESAEVILEKFTQSIYPTASTMGTTTSNKKVANRGGDGVQQMCRPATSESSAANPAVSSRGGILCCVMGGKLSEGINFSDDLCRCVIVVGLPYPSPYDVELQVKAEYLQELLSPSSIANSNNGTSSSSCVISTSGFQPKKNSNNKNNDPVSFLMDSELYHALCMRSVNQSIGRCLRHAQDYSNIILIDSRYQRNEQVMKRLPTWMTGKKQDHHCPSEWSVSGGGVRHAREFRDCFVWSREFFSRMKEKQQKTQK